MLLSHDLNYATELPPLGWRSLGEAAVIGLLPCFTAGFGERMGLFAWPVL